MGAVILAKALRDIFGDRVLGPEKPFVSRVALWYIQSVMLKIEAGASMKKVKDILRAAHARLAEIPQIKTSVIYYGCIRMPQVAAVEFVVNAVHVSQ